MILRGGNKVAYIPGDAIRVTMPTSAAIPWWLSGGISAANCVAAYQPKGAADLAASYVNLANPGTYNVIQDNAPGFDAAVGWTFDGANNKLYAPRITAINGVSALTVAVRLQTNTLSGGGASLRYVCESEEGAAGTTVYILRFSTTSDKMDFYTAGSGYVLATTDNTLNINTEYTIICTYTGSQQLIYLNNTPQTSAARTGSTGSISNTNERAGIGEYYNGVNPQGRLWSGIIRAIAIYNIGVDSVKAGALYTAMAAL